METDRPFVRALSCLLSALTTLIAIPASAQTPGQIGQWQSLISLPFYPVHNHLLPNGKVMIWSGDGTNVGNDPRLWDPATQNLTTLAPLSYNAFCSGHAFLADGRLFVAGGHNGINTSANGDGVPYASLYNPTTNTWSAAPSMNAGRWYPTVTTLANGDALVVSGTMSTSYANNTLPQVYRAGTNTWRNLTSAQLGLDLYPMMFLAPNGKVINVGPTAITRYLDTSGAGSWTRLTTRTFGDRTYGSAVMYDGKVLVLGGGDPPTKSAEVIDLNQPSPAWRSVAPMSVARRQVNATLLPDGNVLVTGGTSGPGFNDATRAVYSAELWNPVTERWTTLATSSAAIPRIYHSAAVLLPDGRVLSTGGNGQLVPEAFSPPYLFKGARPALSAVTSSITYGQTFSVQSPNASSISKVTLIRITSVTHAFNENQRLNTLTFRLGATAGTLDITAPASGNIAPPGHYLLFLVNSSGVPSVGRVVRLGVSVKYSLTVNKSGIESGKSTVISTPAGVMCGSTCTATFASGTAVKLTPQPAAGNVFAGWSGACSGTGACTVTMNAAKTVTASFKRL